jgi:hypothetical protein
MPISKCHPLVKLYLTCIWSQCLKVSLCGPSLCGPSLCGPSLCGPSLCGPSLCGPSLCDPRYATPRYAAPRYAAPRYSAPSSAAPRYAATVSAAPRSATLALWPLALRALALRAIALRPLALRNLTFFLMIEGCDAVLDHFITSNGTSLGGTDLKITLDFTLFHASKTSEMSVLNKIIETNHNELLKHPICESFLHLKWLLVKNYFYTYVFFYLIFVVALSGVVLLDLSPLIKGSNLKSLNRRCFLIAALKLLPLSIWRNTREGPKGG